MKLLLKQDDSNMNDITPILAVLAEDEANKKKCRPDYSPTYYKFLPRPLTNRELKVNNRQDTVYKAVALGGISSQ